MTDYDDFHRRSIAERDIFWAEQARLRDTGDLTTMEDPLALQ